MAVKKGNGSPDRSNGGSDHPPPDVAESDVLPDWARAMIDQERDSVSTALVMAREEFELDDDDLVVMLADMTCDFGADLALAYHGDEARLADDVHHAEATGTVPVLVNVMPPSAWRAFFGEYIPVALQVMEETRPPNTVALAVVGVEGVVVAFAERTLRAITSSALH